MRQMSIGIMHNVGCCIFLENLVCADPCAIYLENLIPRKDTTSASMLCLDVLVPPPGLGSNIDSFDNGQLLFEMLDADDSGTVNCVRNFYSNLYIIIFVLSHRICSGV